MFVLANFLGLFSVQRINDNSVYCYVSFWTINNGFMLYSLRVRSAQKFQSSSFKSLKVRSRASPIIDIEARNLECFLHLFPNLTALISS